MHAKNTVEVPALSSAPQTTGTGFAILVRARAHADAACPPEAPGLVPAANLQHAHIQRAFLAGFEAALEMVNRRPCPEAA